MTEFYRYVKREVKSIPNSICFEMKNIKITHDDFFEHIKLKYNTHLINFNQNIKYIKENINDKECLTINDITTYHFKINNQLFLEYNIQNNSENMLTLINLICYSSSNNADNLILFMDYIGELIKK